MPTSISAYDAATGQLWRFNTVARSDEPGGNTRANLPNFLPGGAAARVLAPDIHHPQTGNAL